MSRVKRVWFYRYWTAKFGGSNGGNLKVRDCYDHVLKSPDLRPLIYFDPELVWNDFPGNHWLDLKNDGEANWDPVEGDVCFFSGSDWRVLGEDERVNPKVPIINIAQPRHARADDKRNKFLKYPAIRIVKSENGARILKEYGVNGPVYVVPDAIDLSLVPEAKFKDIDILVIGLKQPKMARQVYSSLQEWSKEEGLNLNIQVQLPPKLPTRLDFLKLLGRAKLALCIPLSAEKGEEGFYLPPLEAMAMETIVVTSHAIGNVDHCKDGYNCVVTTCDVNEYVDAVIRTWGMSNEGKSRLKENGLNTAKSHDIHEERKALLEIILNSYEIWSRSFE